MLLSWVNGIKKKKHVLWVVTLVRSNGLKCRAAALLSFKPKHVLCDLTYISTLEKKSILENTEAVKQQFKLSKGNFGLFPIKYILIIISFPTFPPMLYLPQPSSNSIPFFFSLENQQVNKINQNNNKKQRRNTRNKTYKTHKYQQKSKMMYLLTDSCFLS